MLLFTSYLSKANVDFVRAFWHFRLPANSLYIFCELHQFYNGHAGHTLQWLWSKGNFTLPLVVSQMWILWFLQYSVDQARDTLKLFFVCFLWREIDRVCKYLCRNPNFLPTKSPIIGPCFNSNGLHVNHFHFRDLSSYYALISFYRNYYVHILIWCTMYVTHFYAHY